MTADWSKPWDTDGGNDWCPTCQTNLAILDEFDEQIGVEEQARPVHIIALACGHEIVTERGRR